MKIYIAGPMTGYPDFNYPAFFRASQDLLDVGHEPVNPARAEGREGCETWLDFMRAALRDIADADAVALLPGWQNSRGAALEQRLGVELGLPVRPLEAWLEESTHTPTTGVNR